MRGPFRLLVASFVQGGVHMVPMGCSPHPPELPCSTSEASDHPAAAAAYRDLLEKLRARVAAGRLGAALAANRELILLYWDIGLRAILERQAEVGMGRRKSCDRTRRSSAGQRFLT